ncbi:MAG: hypothetical protein A2W26_10090 [Acidobacteria bacterium RBG_16_64_8]|nr:MAG: hypothetical protein A2W26_10090 [Acidobacteria bacterium RBG_16_64_8]
MKSTGRRGPRVGLACVFHESNTFLQRRTTLDDIRRRSIAQDRILADVGGTQTALGGMIDHSAGSGFELVPLVYSWVIPSGPLESTAFEILAAELEEALRAAAPLDALLLELHGAMTAENHVRADAELTAMARSLVGTAPIVAVIDPHANLADALVDNVDVLLAYQENPHTDMARRGGDATRVLAEMLGSGLQPVTVARHAPVIATPIAQASSDEPLASLISMARALEAQQDIVCASLLFGFLHADVPDLGMAAVVSARDHDQAARGADALAARCWDLREGFARELMTPEESVAKAFALDGLTAIADTGDNIGGGAPGDSSVLLREALEHGGIRFATTIWAPNAVAEAAATAEGAAVRTTLGSPPLDVTARVLAVRPGTFIHDGPLSRGVQFDMGTVAVLQIDRVQLLVQTHAVPPNDKSMFRTFGIDVGTLDAVALKGAVAIRAGWSSLVKDFLPAATPGPTTCDVSQLSFKHATRSLWPLDDVPFRAA